MKIPYFLILTVCASVTSVHAEEKLLPPVLDNSTYSNAIPAPSAAVPAPSVAAPAQATTLQPPQLTAPSYDDSTNLEKLKADIVELKNKVHEQEAAINSLKRANSEWQKKSPDLNKTTTTSLKAPDSNKNGAISLKAPTLELSPASETIKSSPIPETEKERYQHASDLLKKANYSQAQQEFEALIKKYPTGSYADNAQYWIGVALLNRGDKKAAIQAFDHLARTYPKSDKIPDALFKLADTLISLKNKPKAKEYLDYVIQNYPGTNGAKLAAEKKRQEKL